MKHVLVCPVCKHRIAVATKLNDTGREMLARRGPPKCPVKSCARMLEQWEASS